jgi:serine/threonine-protein kinase RsbW
MSVPAARAGSVQGGRPVSAMSGPDAATPEGSGPHPGSDGEREASVVELRVAARARMVATVRAMAAQLAGRADFDIDTIADLRLAVDEACGSLIEVAPPSATLECVFSVDADAMSVVVGTVTEAPASLDTSGFGWQLLRALTDRVELESHPDGHPGPIAIRFAVRADRCRS